MNESKFLRTPTFFGFALASAFVLASPSVMAQSAPETPAPSPKAKVEQRVGITDLSIDYSSPGVKGRKIWGGLVPYDQVWRTGANAATLLKVSRDFTFAGKPVKAGTYAFYTLPTAKAWTVILSNQVENWGSNGYDQKQDVLRVTVNPVASPMRERMTFVFSDVTDDSARIDLEWEKLRISVPIGLDTKAHVMAGIEEALGGAWRPHFASARWMLENGGDVDKALGYVETSIAIKATWWNHWVKAQLLAKKGKKADAFAAGTKAQELGKGDRVYEGFFKEDVTKTVAGWK